MYTPSDIQNAARKINNEENELRNKENRFKSEIETVNSWWKGNASKSLVQGYREAGFEINKIYSGADNLESGLRRLASEVDRADDERRRQRIEAEKRRLEQLKNKKK